MKRYGLCLKKRDGFMSVIVILLLSVLFPLLLFFMVELEHYYGTRNQFQGYVDAAASAAVMQIHRDMLSEGFIEIDPKEAENYAKKVLATNLGLNDDLTVTESSLVQEEPLVHVYVVDPNDLEDEPIYEIPDGIRYEIEHPTVIVYMEAQPKGIFFNHFVNLKVVSAYQASFKTSETIQVTSNRIVSGDGIVVRLANVVNPLRFLEQNPFPADWRFNPVPMVAGGNIEVVLENQGGYELVRGDYVLQIESEANVETVSGTLKKKGGNLTATIEIPETVPVGAKVYLSFKDVFLNDAETIREADVLMNEPLREQIGYIESNIHKLFRIQKIFPFSE